MRRLVAASIVLASVACTRMDEFDRRMDSPDDNYLSAVARELDAAGVDFRVPRDGSIAYRSGDAEKVRAIEERLKKEGVAGTKPAK